MMRTHRIGRALLAIAIISAACSNNTSSTPTRPSSTPAPTPAPAKGTVVTQKHASAALGVTKQVVVYLPAGYDTSTKRYPVFYYLHGLGGDETNWVEEGNLPAAADALGLEAIVVMPDGDDGFYIDSPKQVDYDACLAEGTGLFFPQRPRRATCVRASKYATYVVDELVAWVDATYRTIASREGRAIAGLSMGGFGALQLAMRHPERFVAAASHSGVDALLYAGPIPYAKGKVVLAEDVKKWGDGIGPLGTWIRGIFGPDLATWRSHDPAHLVTQLAADGPSLYLDCGTEDGFLLHNGMQYVHDLLLERGIDHAYYLGPGRHDFAFWTERLPHSLAFLRGKAAQAR